MLRLTLRVFAPMMLLLLAWGCGANAGDPADPASSATDSEPTPSSGFGVEGAVSAQAGGRDPPATTTPGAGADSLESDGGLAPNAVVERVVDGDTIIAAIGGRSETVRLIGLDAPESVAPTRPVQCFGPEASQFLGAVLPAGTEITLVRDVEARDIYDRLLGYVVRSHDGLFVNLEIVAAGYAAVLIYPPNDHYAEAFSWAEAQAVASGLGLWSVCGGPDVPLG